MKGKKTKPEFSRKETEAEYVRTGPDDAELDFQVRDQSIFPRYKNLDTGKIILGKGDKSISDTTFLKNYATKKKPTIKETLETTKKKKQIKHLNKQPHEDPRISEPDYDDYLPDIDDLD